MTPIKHRPLPFQVRWMESPHDVEYQVADLPNIGAAMAIFDERARQVIELSIWSAELIGPNGPERVACPTPHLPLALPLRRAKNRFAEKSDTWVVARGAPALAGTLRRISTGPRPAPCADHAPTAATPPMPFLSSLINKPEASNEPEQPKRLGVIRTVSGAPVSVTIRKSRANHAIA